MHDPIKIKKVQSISRRDAIKLIGLSPVAATMLAQTTMANQLQGSQEVGGKIVIVGGGAGAIMVLSRLLATIKNPNITIIAPNEIHLYQPGQIFIGAGLMQREDIVLHNSHYIDEERVQWIKDAVASFEPEKNRLTTRSGQKIGYDALIVAAGVDYHYEAIKGLSKDDIGKNGIASVYLSDLEKGTVQGAEATWRWYNDIKKAARTSKPTVLFTHPNTPIKCGGAPQKVLYLCADYLKEAGLEANYIFASSNAKLFHLPSVEAALKKVQASYKTITSKMQHHLESVDVKAKEATFIHAWEEEVYDKDFETTETVSKSERITIAYDFLHVVPPMAPAQAVADSQLVGSSGWLEVDKFTLQHKKYANIFGIGDICGIPMGKTGGSARHHAPVVCANVIATLQGKQPAKRFDGYTVCPIKTQYGKIIMAEFNYDGPSPTIPFLAIDKPRWFWWAFDLYMLEPMYKYLMLRGRM